MPNPSRCAHAFSACADVCTQLQSTRHRRKRARSIRALANPSLRLKRSGMSKLRDLYPVGDDEDVAAIALYRHLQRYGHCCPRKKTQTQK
jgi:hypothetical protein